MITVNIYRVIGCYNCDWIQVEKRKRFQSPITAHKYCAYVAPKVHGHGQYAYILTK